MAYELSEDRKKYIAALELLREQNKALRKKHASKVYKGFCKMCKRQDEKPENKTIELPKIQLPKHFKGEYTHCFIVDNNKWNGMNLKTLCTQQFDRCGNFKSPFTVNALTGKYSLTLTGHKKLKRLKGKRQQN